jgi:hypothetical protein
MVRNLAISQTMTTQNNNNNLSLWAVDRSTATSTPASILFYLIEKVAYASADAEHDSLPLF